MGEDRDLSGSDLSSEQGGVFAHPLPPGLWVTNGEQQKKKETKLSGSCGPAALFLSS